MADCPHPPVPQSPATSRALRITPEYRLRLERTKSLFPIHQFIFSPEVNNSVRNLNGAIFDDRMQYTLILACFRKDMGGFYISTDTGFAALHPDSIICCRHVFFKAAVTDRCFGFFFRPESETLSWLTGRNQVT